MHAARLQCNHQGVYISHKAWHPDLSWGKPMEAAEHMYAWLLGRLVLLTDHDANTWQLSFGVTALFVPILAAI